MIKKLIHIKEEPGRDLDESIDEETLVPGESGPDSNSQFGSFKFFTGIRRFFRIIRTLGELNETSKLAVVNEDGSVSYITPSVMWNYTKSKINETDGVWGFASAASTKYVLLATFEGSSASAVLSGELHVKEADGTIYSGKIDATVTGYINPQGEVRLDEGRLLVDDSIYDRAFATYTRNGNKFVVKLYAKVTSVNNEDTFSFKVTYAATGATRSSLDDVVLSSTKCTDLEGTSLAKIRFDENDVMRAMSGKSRLTSLNLTPADSTEYGEKRFCLSTSSAVTGRPNDDGFVDTYFWDNSGRYDAQLFISNNPNNPIKVRHRNNGEWPDSWKEIPFSDNVIKIDGSNATATGVSTMINKLTEGTSDPVDNDYYVAQYAGGGTATTTYHRRPVKALWNYIKGKMRLLSGDKDNETHDCNSALTNGFYYYTSNGPATSIGASTTDGSLYVQRYNDTWISQIAQDYRNGNIFVRAKNNGTWTSWARVAKAGEIPTSLPANGGTAAKLTSTNITIQTGASKVAKISLSTLVTWLVNQKHLSTSNLYQVLQTSWAYANNDILQLTANGTNYELQLAGVVMEFIGTVTNYNTGMFRLRIHSSPTTSFTVTSGYTVFPVSHIAEYTCNGSGYTPTWRILADKSDIPTSLPANGGTADYAKKIKDSSTNNDITITYSKAGQVSTSWLASWNGYELGSIAPSKITAGYATTAYGIRISRPNGTIPNGAIWIE